jgi:hypothetical protein
MLFSSLLLSAMASVAMAAPVGPTIRITPQTDATDAISRVSDYFNMLADKTQAAKAIGKPPVCDLSRAHMPAGVEQLPMPDGFKVRHVALGRGTQNYTCDLSNSTAVPVAAGAVAVLYNASCMAAAYPELLERLPGTAIHLSPVDTTRLLGVRGPLAPSGAHYFRDKTTAFFDLDMPDPERGFGKVACKKREAVAAPPAAPVGQAGEKAVPWLLLDAVDGTTDNVKTVYRVNTAGGSAPATCRGQAATFQVDYAAVYWFWQS